MEFWTHIKTKCSCSLDSKDLSQKTVLWVCLLKSVDTRASGHTTKLRHQRTHRLGDWDSRNYMDIYVSNQWTHGLLDTQQKNVSLFYSVEIFFYKSISIKALWVCPFKSMDTWTRGHTTKQCLSSVKSSRIYIIICFKSVDSWTFGHTAKNTSLLKGIKWFFFSKSFVSRYVYLN